jgi:LysM repeat protein
MSEQPQTGRGSVSSTLIWAVAGVVIGLALFAVTLVLNRTGQTYDTAPVATVTASALAAVKRVGPIATSASTNANAADAVTFISYTIKSGDVLGTIAEQFGVSTEAILQANAATLANPDQLQIGQLLRIPVNGAQAQSLPVQAAATAPVPTLLPPDAMQKHVIARGEVLSTLALKYGVSLDALRTANNLSDDTIRAGDTLIIPIPRNASEPAPTDAPSTAIKNTTYAFSTLEGDLAVAYPLSENGSNFTVHYQPDTPAATEIQSIVAFLEQAQKSIVKSLGVRFTGRFDVYLAGSLFSPPDQALRGRSFSAKRTTFVLYDGSGNDAEHRYMLAHELTHLIAWNTYGPAKSAMLSEGAAVFAGEPYLLAGKFLPIRNFCLAYRRAEVLPLVASSSLTFGGHLLSQDVYYASGCFVQYLIKTYGAAKFGKLYSSLDYPSVYGRTLEQLQRNWLANLDADKTRLPFAAEALPNAYEALLKDYVTFFARVGNSDALDTGAVNVDTYRELDQRRLNVLMGKLN